MYIHKHDFTVNISSSSEFLSIKYNKPIQGGSNPEIKLTACKKNATNSEYTVALTLKADEITEKLPILMNLVSISGTFSTTPKIRLQKAVIAEFNSVYNPAIPEENYTLRELKELDRAKKEN
jgi:hypothetical protein